MKHLARMSIVTRLVTIMTTLLVMVCGGVFATFIAEKNRHLQADIDKQLDMAVTIFADELVDDVPGLRAGPVAEGFMTGLSRVEGELPVTMALVDSVSALTGSHVTYFVRNPATGEFERLMTSVERPDGTRAVGTVLDPAGPAHAALNVGQPYKGGAEILGIPYATIYEPVFDETGAIAGAVFAGVPTSQANEILIGYIVSVLGMLAVILVVGLTAGYVLIKRQMAPVRDLVTGIGGLARKDYDVVIAAPKTEDEIGDLARACITLRDDLRDAARLAETASAQEAEREQLRSDLSRVIDDLRAGLVRLADGDLTTAIPNPPDRPFPADYEPLRQSYNSVTERLGEVIQQVNTIAQSVRDSAVEIAGASRELSGRAETQAATLEQSAAALTQLTESVGSTAERATRAQEASFGNRTGAERGTEIVRDAVTAMQEIERGSEQITRIIGVIEDIAFQTNLLALNAGVEAARAGEAGRGFAVVASEVRLLAQRAAESAREIRGLISDSTQQVGRGSALVRRTGDSLAEILDRANEAAGLVADIALAAAEQARGLAEVNTGVNQLDHVTQQNSAVAEETSAAALTLQSRSEELIVALAGFRTRTRASAPAPAIARPAVPDDRPLVEANIVDWVPTATAAANSPRANARRQTKTWAEF